MALRICFLLLCLALTSSVGGRSVVSSECLDGPSGMSVWEFCNRCLCSGDEDPMDCALRKCIKYTTTKKPEIWLPNRPGPISDFKPGRSVVRPEVSKDWQCQWGSRWLENEGCVQCFCTWGGIAECGETGLCRQSVQTEDKLDIANSAFRRRRQISAEDESKPPPSSIASSLLTVSEFPESVASPETVTSQETKENISGNVETTSVKVMASSIGPLRVNPQSITTAQATVVKERSCKSGSTWEEDCNTCWCLDNGMAACTTQRCDRPGSPTAAPVAAPSTPPAEVTEEVARTTWASLVPIHPTSLTPSSN